MKKTKEFIKAKYKTLLLVHKEQGGEDDLFDAMDEYAEQTAIAFKSWCFENERQLRLENMQGKFALTNQDLFNKFMEENK